MAGGFNALSPPGGTSNRGDGPPSINLPSNPPSGGPQGPTQPGEGPDSPAAGAVGAGGTSRGPVDEMMAAHDYARSLYDTITRSRNLMDHIRREMDQLVRKGDTVQPTDVISAAGRVVSHGVGAKEMATILADMPPAGGQGLAAWLQAHDANITQQEMHIEMVQEIARHRLGQAALRVIAGTHMRQSAQEAAKAARAGMGQMTPSPRPVTAPPGQGPAMPPNALTAPSGNGGGGGEASDQ